MGKRKVLFGALALAACMCMVLPVTAGDKYPTELGRSMTPAQGSGSMVAPRGTCVCPGGPCTELCQNTPACEEEDSGVQCSTQGPPQTTTENGFARVWDINSAVGDTFTVQCIDFWVSNFTSTVDVEVVGNVYLKTSAGTDIDGLTPDNADIILIGSGSVTLIAGEDYNGQEITIEMPYPVWLPADGIMIAEVWIPDLTLIDPLPGSVWLGVTTNATTTAFIRTEGSCGLGSWIAPGDVGEGYPESQYIVKVSGEVGGVAPNGACCYSDGGDPASWSCTDTSLTDCITLAAGHEYDWDVTATCATLNPPCGEGACCFADGAGPSEPASCVIEDEVTCKARTDVISWTRGALCEDILCYAAPTNDDCANAMPINAETDYVVSNMGATLDGPDVLGGPFSICSEIPVEGDVWFKYVVSENGELLLGTLGTPEMDTVMDVWSRNGSEPVCQDIIEYQDYFLMCNDDLLNAYNDGCYSPLDPPEGIAGLTDSYIGTYSYRASVFAGDNLFIRVGGYAGQGNEFGDFNLRLEVRPSNTGRCWFDDGTACVDTTASDCLNTLGGTWWTDLGEYCQQVSCGTFPVLPGTNCMNAIDLNPGQDMEPGDSVTVTGTLEPGRAMYYKYFVHTPGAPIVIDTCGSEIDTVLNLWQEGYCGIGWDNQSPVAPDFSRSGGDPVKTNDNCTAIPGLPCSYPDPTDNGESCICYHADSYAGSPPIDYTNYGIIEVVNNGDDAGEFTLTLLESELPGCQECVSDCGCKGDMNQDGVINGADIQAFVEELIMDPQDCSSTTWCLANMDGDLDVDMRDLGWFVYALLIPWDCAGDDITCGDEDYCQLDMTFPSHGSDNTLATISDLDTGFNYVCKDNFFSFTGGNVTKVCWWGIYYSFNSSADCGPAVDPVTDDFQVTYYADDGGQLGLVKAGPFNVTPVRTSTGVQQQEVDVWQYEATHDPVAIGPGECVWISIVNHTEDGDGCAWFWVTAPAGDSYSLQTDEAADFDLAFCVNVVLNPNACPATCDVECPEGALDEGEADCAEGFVDTVNGGCFSDPPAFTEIACGDTYCGTVGIFDAAEEGTIQRDSDWYRLVVTEQTAITLTFDTEFELLYFLFQGDYEGSPCPAVIPDDLVIAGGGYLIHPCPDDPAVLAEEWLEPGTYYIYIAPDWDYEYLYPGMQPCGSAYTMTLDCTSCPVYTDCLGVCAGGPEGEACGETVNDGCNMEVPAFGSITCNDGLGICGTAWADDGSRDTDWFEFTLTESKLVTATLTSEFEGTVLLIRVDDCGGEGVDPTLALFGQGYSSDCTAGSAIAMLDAGTYVALVTTANEDGSIFNCLPCTGTGTHYHLELFCSDATECSHQNGCQIVTGETASFSDTGHSFRAADNFKPTENGSVSHVCWFGLYLTYDGGWIPCAAEPADTFNIRYYSDDGSGGNFGGQPGTLIQEFTGVTPVNKAATGETFAGADVYMFEFAHTGVPVTAGDCYWFSIEHDDAAAPDCNFLWIYGAAGDQLASSYEYAATAWSPTDGDKAWCLDIAVEADGCGLPKGACCVNGVCAGTTTYEQCVGALGGYWYEDEECPGFSCPAIDCGSVTYTQNMDPVNVTPLTTLACGASGLNADNYYCRTYPLEDTLYVKCVDFGVETCEGAGVNGYPITINIYQDTDADPTNGVGTLLGTKTVNVVDAQTGTIVKAVFDPPVTVAEGEMVVEMFQPDSDDVSFYFGSNTAGETQTGYLMAADCGLSSYAAISSIGTFHIIQVVHGDE